MMEHGLNEANVMVLKQQMKKNVIQLTISANCYTVLAYCELYNALYWHHKVILYLQNRTGASWVNIHHMHNITVWPTHYQTNVAPHILWLLTKLINWANNIISGWYNMLLIRFITWLENASGITGPLWGESTADQWIPLTKGQ